MSFKEVRIVIDEKNVIVVVPPDDDVEIFWKEDPKGVRWIVVENTGAVDHVRVVHKESGNSTGNHFPNIERLQLKAAKYEILEYCPLIITMNPDPNLDEDIWDYSVIGFDDQGMRFGAAADPRVRIRR